MIEQILQALMYPFLFFSMYFQIFLLMSFLENKKKIKNEEIFDLSYFPSVTVAVPCWNEEKTLTHTLESLLALDYPMDKLKIVVVDDGSKDKTFEIASLYANHMPDTISVIKKENGGKHTAVNLVLSQLSTDLFGCLDADSFVEPQTLRHIVSCFQRDKEIMAVTPCIHIRNPQTPIQRLQAVEYLINMFFRKAFEQVDAIQVAPGPFSIFKKEVFERIGPYRKAHNTEDFEITLRMHLHHMKIANSHKALLYTVGPSTIFGFLKQHLRWARGFLENAIDYREMFFKKEYGNFGMFTLPGAFVLVFYGVYVSFFILYNIVNLVINLIVRFITIGIHMPTFSFDIFYLDTSMISFLAMVMLTVLLFVLYLASELSDDNQQFFRNFPVFFVMFPILVPIYISRAVFDTMFHRKNEWILQDTKMVKSL